MIPKKTSEMDLNPKDQKDILEYLKNLEDKDVCRKLRENMSTPAILFCLEIVEAFSEFIE